jgi:hypothetical protein
VSCLFLGNQAGTDGGAAYLGTGSVEIAECTFVGNQGRRSGGAVYNLSSCAMTSTPIENNSAQYGGGICNEGQISLLGLTISSNRAYGWGGGVRNTGNLVISESTVSANVAYDSYSGAIGGGLLNEGISAVTNSTFSGNQVLIQSSQFSRLGGGGIYAGGRGMLLVNCTIASNSVSILGARGSGLAVGGGILSDGGVTVVNTVVADNQAPDLGQDLCGAFLSTGFDLIGNNQGATGLSINDYQNVAANLGPLQDNGGPTFTHALLQGSLAIGGGTSVGAPATDQRGVARPPGHCDIGAFQLTTVITPAITWSNPPAIVYGTALGTNQLNATSSVDGTFVYSPAAGTIFPAGSNYLLTAVFTPKDLANYTLATNSVSLNVLKADQTIAFPPIANQRIGDPPVLLSATADSGLPVAFTLMSGPATLTGSLLTFGSASGLVTVRASQPGNTNYNPAPNVDRSFVVGTLPLPAITAQPSSVAVNPGNRVTLSVVATNGPLSYQWRIGGTYVSSETGSSLVLARVQQSQAGRYDVIVSNPSGSVTSLVAVLTVKITAGTPFIAIQPRNQGIRAGETATLSVVASGSAPLLYQWYEGSSGDTSRAIPGATNSKYTTGSLSGSTSFWVSVGNLLGTVDSAAASVTVFPPNAAKLEMRMTSGLPILSIDGIPGITYRIEYRASLSVSNWSELVDLPLPSTPFKFIDADLGGATSRFYRVIIP